MTSPSTAPTVPVPQNPNQGQQQAATPPDQNTQQNGTTPPDQNGQTAAQDQQNNNTPQADQPVEPDDLVGVNFTGATSAFGKDAAEKHKELANKQYYERTDGDRDAEMAEKFKVITDDNGAIIYKGLVNKDLRGADLSDMVINLDDPQYKTAGDPGRTMRLDEFIENASDDEIKKLMGDMIWESQADSATGATTFSSDKATNDRIVARLEKVSKPMDSLPYIEPKNDLRGFTQARSELLYKDKWIDAPDPAGFLEAAKKEVEIDYAVKEVKLRRDSLNFGKKFNKLKEDSDYQQKLETFWSSKPTAEEAAKNPSLDANLTRLENKQKELSERSLVRLTLDEFKAKQALEDEYLKNNPGKDPSKADDKRDIRRYVNDNSRFTEKLKEVKAEAGFIQTDKRKESLEASSGEVVEDYEDRRRKIKLSPKVEQLKDEAGNDIAATYKVMLGNKDKSKELAAATLMSPPEKNIERFEIRAYNRDGEKAKDQLGSIKTLFGDLNARVTYVDGEDQQKFKSLAEFLPKADLNQDYLLSLKGSNLTLTKIDDSFTPKKGEFQLVFKKMPWLGADATGNRVQMENDLLSGPGGVKPADEKLANLPEELKKAFDNTPNTPEAEEYRNKATNLTNNIVKVIEQWEAEGFNPDDPNLSIDKIDDKFKLAGRIVEALGELSTDSTLKKGPNLTSFDGWGKVESTVPKSERKLNHELANLVKEKIARPALLESTDAVRKYSSLEVDLFKKVHEVWDGAKKEQQELFDAVADGKDQEDIDKMSYHRTKEVLKNIQDQLVDAHLNITDTIANTDMKSRMEAEVNKLQEQYEPFLNADLDAPLPDEPFAAGNQPVNPVQPSQPELHQLGGPNTGPSLAKLPEKPLEGPHNDKPPAEVLQKFPTLKDPFDAAVAQDPEREEHRKQAANLANYLGAVAEKWEHEGFDPKAANLSMEGNQERWEEIVTIVEALKEHAPDMSFGQDNLLDGNFGTQVSQNLGGQPVLNGDEGIIFTNLVDVVKSEFLTAEVVAAQSWQQKQDDAQSTMDGLEQKLTDQVASKWGDILAQSQEYKDKKGNGDDVSGHEYVQTAEDLEGLQGEIAIVVSGIKADPGLSDQIKEKADNFEVKYNPFYAADFDDLDEDLPPSPTN